MYTIKVLSLWSAHMALEKKKLHGGWIILGWILERRDGVMWTGLDWLRIGTGGELL
jgi:hypothetical protein